MGGGNFLVGEVFNEENFGFYGDFNSKLILPSKTQRLSVDILDGKKLRHHFLQRIVKDSMIRMDTQSTPMTKDEFFVLSFLLNNPETSKNILGCKLRTEDYLFHVSIGSGDWVTIKKFFFNKPSYAAFPFNHPHRILGSATFIFLEKEN